MNRFHLRIRLGVIIGVLALLVALPILLRRDSATGSPSGADDRLVVLTPHNESIRHEFGEAFAAWWRRSTGRSVYLDWRTPGGTSEIRMVLDAGYQAAEESGRGGIGVDVLFGGGVPDFAGQARLGRLVPLRVFENQPGWFGEDAAIPPEFTGESYYPPEKNWVGTCLSQFGICYNPDGLKRLGLAPPRAWRDLGDPRYAGTLALADPTKSGSVARAFELLVQGEMQRVLRSHPGDRAAALEAGWAEGLRLIQRLAANARYFTDSASKIPLDVGQGNAVAGMCIDFYGRSFADELSSPGGRQRLAWIAPAGGTTLSADPVAVLKGTARMDLAQAFVEFCLTPEAQVLWFGRPGTPGGPQSRALHRVPIRRDGFTADHLRHSTMPQAAPYDDPANLVYQKELTGRSFNTLRQLIKAMCIDSHEEMKAAWRAMEQAGMPADALAVFSDVSIMPYARGGAGDAAFDGSDPLQTAGEAARIGGWFRENYRRAHAMAEGR